MATVESSEAGETLGAGNIPKPVTSPAPAQTVSIPSPVVNPRPAQTVSISTPSPVANPTLAETQLVPSVSLKSGPLSVLDTALAMLCVEESASAAGGAAQNVPTAGTPEISIGGVNYVCVDVTAKDRNGVELLTQLQSVGLKGGSSFGAIASGFLPVDKVAALLQVQDLAFASASAMNSGVGNVTSQADTAELASAARAAYGVDGTGLKIGVLSDSFDTSGSPDTMASDIASNDLPASTTILAEGPPGATDEGRAMAQLVHDIAPGAAISFATAFAGGQAGFANNITALASSGAKVIVDDVHYFAEPAFQDGVIAQAIENAVAGGAVYFSAAGNDGREGWEGAFNPEASPVTIDSYSERLQQFATGQDYLPVKLAAGEFFVLQWDQPAASAGGAGAQSDLDLFLTDQSGNTVYVASATGNTGGDPVEVMQVNGGAGGTYYLRVGLYSGPAPTEIKLMALGNGAPVDLGTTASNINKGTVYGHAAAADGIAVAAARYSSTPAYGVSPAAVESFSSGGPTRIWYDTAGNRYGAPVLRGGPAITAADGVHTTFFGQYVDFSGFPSFFGTSAAAPDAAAVAALMLEAQPALNATDIRNLLQDSASDMDDPLTVGFDKGVDTRTGAGFLNAKMAVGYAKNLVIAANASKVQFLGTHLNDIIKGGAGSHALDGQGGSDKLDYSAAPFAVSLNAVTGVATNGFGGTDHFANFESYTGSTHNDVFNAGPGNNTFTGLGGVDRLSYAAAPGPVTIDASLGTAINGFGGTDSFTGIETFAGTAGNDSITGGAGANTLIGYGGADTLVGGAGPDMMYGGAGDDTYYVDNVGDSIVEGGGNDTVFSTVSYTLPLNVENLTLQGAGNINATGNTLANTLTGNSGNNVLNGGAGADIMAGGDGNDRYVVDNAGDQVIEAPGPGIDKVSAYRSYALPANVENLTLLGVGNFSATGNGDPNVIVGNIGNNAITGGDGADTLSGGLGADTFRYGAPSEGGDIIKDFVPGTDKIGFKSANFGGLPVGALQPSNFALGTPLDGDDYFIFDTTLHTLDYDSDGSGGGAAVAIATFSNGVKLSAKDIVITA